VDGGAGSVPDVPLTRVRSDLPEDPAAVGAGPPAEPAAGPGGGHGAGDAESAGEGGPPDEASFPPKAIPAAPPVADGTERRLDPAVVRLWAVGGVLRALVWSAIAATAALTVPGGRPWLPAAAAILLVVGGTAWWWARLRYRAWSFLVRDRELIVRYGVLWRVTSVIPHARIQHVDTRHGPLERLLGLSSVVVFTAGVRGADVAIPGLSAGDAEALREHLARVGATEDAV
jgi:uncharacterized protein